MSDYTFDPYNCMYYGECGGFPPEGTTFGTTETIPEVVVVADKKPVTTTATPTPTKKISYLGLGIAAGALVIGMIMYKKVK